MVLATNGLCWGCHNIQYRLYGLSRLYDNGFFSEELGSFFFNSVFLPHPNFGVKSIDQSNWNAFHKSAKMMLQRGNFPVYKTRFFPSKVALRIAVRLKTPENAARGEDIHNYCSTLRLIQ
jgi:hypothetical protein